MEKYKSIYSDIYKIIRTKDELQEALSQIDSVFSATYRINQEQKDLAAELSPQLAELVMKRIAAQGGSPSDIAVVHEALHELKEILEKAAQVQVTLAIQPSSGTISKLSSWFQEIFPGYLTVLDITVDQTILGGAIVVYEGRYRDYSLRKQIDEYFKVSKVH